jgi:hypothetical protein
VIISDGMGHAAMDVGHIIYFVISFSFSWCDKLTEASSYAMAFKVDPGLGPLGQEGQSRSMQCLFGGV